MRNSFDPLIVSKYSSFSSQEADSTATLLQAQALEQLLQSLTSSLPGGDAGAVEHMRRLKEKLADAAMEAQSFAAQQVRGK